MVSSTFPSAGHPAAVPTGDVVRPGIVEVLSERPVRVRLGRTGRAPVGFFEPTEGESDEAFVERIAAAFREMPKGRRQAIRLHLHDTLEHGYWGPCLL
jgi:hypothetical protein